MIQEKESLDTRITVNEEGKEAFSLTDLTNFEGKNPKLRLYAHVRVQPGEEVSYHTHYGESESYYILAGRGLYWDNDKEMVVNPGTVTLTTSGNGHAIRNIGENFLEFMAFILLD